jgi:hypothetical protein
MGSRCFCTCSVVCLILAACTGPKKAPTPDAPLPAADAASDPANDPITEAPADGVRDAARDAAADQITCPAGATDVECLACGPTLPSWCERVCPAVDCSGYPRPAECDDICAGKCCTCQVAGPTYRWQAPALPCSTACGDMLSRWDAYLADPAMVACTSSLECIAVGGQPTMDPCNGHSTIGYCGKAANRAAYAASPAASLETAFAADCPDHKAYDCGPAYPTCSNGKCTIAGFGCCLCGPPDARPDVPIDMNTPAEAGGIEVAGIDTVRGEAIGQ